MDVLCVGRQFVEHIAAQTYRVEPGEVLGELRHRLGYARLRQVVAVLVEVEFAQSQISQRLVIALACALADRQTVVGHSLGGVAAAEIEIAYGVIYLVEVLGIAVIAHHAPQSLDLRLDIVALIHLALAYAGVNCMA